MTEFDHLGGDFHFSLFCEPDLIVLFVYQFCWFRMLNGEFFKHSTKSLNSNEVTG